MNTTILLFDNLPRMDYPLPVALKAVEDFQDNRELSNLSYITRFNLLSNHILKDTLVCILIGRSDFFVLIHIKIMTII
jgi:hypothetical protein